MSRTDWQVHKFGGTSLADAECFKRVVNLLHDQDGPRQAVVVSAMGGMTDALLRLVVEAEQSSTDGVQNALDAIATRYKKTAEILLQDTKRRAEILDEFQGDLKDAGDLLQAIVLVRKASDRSRDLIAGYGELWSARLLAALLAETAAEDKVGREVRWVDARELIVIEQRQLGPAVLWDPSQENADRIFAGQQK